jgi:hypothetical protein
VCNGDVERNLTHILFFIIPEFEIEISDSFCEAEMFFSIELHEYVREESDTH